MNVMQVGTKDFMRRTIRAEDYDQWLQLMRLRDAHRSNYLFDSPTGLVHPGYAVVDHIYIDVDENRNRPDRILNDYFEEKDIRRMFVSSGRHFHLLLNMKRIPSRYASVSIRSYTSLLSMETGVTFDPISSDLLHLRRAVGSINPKSGSMTCYYDPNTFETSLEPIILGSKDLEIPVVKVDVAKIWEDVRKRKLKTFYKRNSMVDPYSLGIKLPSDVGHHSRIRVLRQLRNAGVNKTRTLEFMRDWLTEEKYNHMIGEGVADRVFNNRL